MMLDNAVNYYREHIAPRFNALAQRHPHPYLALVTLVALAGYAFLASFPLMLIIGTEKLTHWLPNLSSNFTATLLLTCLVWLSLILISALVSYRIFSLRFPNIEGLHLPQEKSPALFDLLENLLAEQHHPQFKQVLITDHHELQIIKTPIVSFPFWYSRKLLIGLPLLQTLSADHFRCALARKLAQFNGHENILTNWLYQLRDIWPQYLKALRGGPRRFGDQPLYWFFCLYTPFYRSISVSAARLDELLSDQKVLDTINNDDLFKSIESQIIGKTFLSRHYWPSIQHMTKRDPKAGILPYAKLEQVIQSALSQYNLTQWLEQQYETERQHDDPMPSLKARMDMLGRTKIKAPELHQPSAATVYLATSYKEVVRHFDEKWLRRQRRYTRQRITGKQKTAANQTVRRPLLTPDNHSKSDSVYT